MQIIEAPPAPLSLTGIFSNIQLLAPEKKRVESAREKIASIMGIISSTMPDSKFVQMQGNSWLHEEADRAGEAFGRELTQETAAAFHDALVRVRDAEVSFPQIDNYCHAGMAAASLSLRDVAEAVIDRAGKLLETEAGAHRAAMVKAAATFGDDHELASFDRRLDATRNALDGELVEARRDPQSWLAQRGL